MLIVQPALTTTKRNPGSCELCLHNRRGLLIRGALAPSRAEYRFRFLYLSPKWIRGERTLSRKLAPDAHSVGKVSSTVIPQRRSGSVSSRLITTV